jgi:hypothetical protein
MYSYWIPPLACFVTAAVGLSPARAEFDAGGVPSKPAQLQANRPPQVNRQRPFEELFQSIDGVRAANGGVILIDISDDAVPTIFLAAPVRPLIVKPAPAKKVAPIPAKIIPPIQAKPILIPPEKK